MNRETNNQIRKFLHAILLAGISLSLCLGMSAAPAGAQSQAGVNAVTTRHGGWLDQIDFSVTNELQVIKLITGALDVYASPLSISELPSIQAGGLNYATLLGQSYAIMYNPAVCADSTRLNPFNDRKIREATNLLYDRSSINQQIYAGVGKPKFTVLQTGGPDYADQADVAQVLEAKYAFNEAKAISDIATEMTVLGATQGQDGIWRYGGNLVTLIFLIRTDGDGTRRPLGDYVAGQLEKAGFNVERQYKKSSEANPIWQHTSTECQWNAYTAGWATTPIERDERSLFQGMYLPTSSFGYPQPFGSNVPDPVFQQVGDTLASASFTNLQQRHDLMAQALPLSLQDSLQVMILDNSNFAPYRSNVQIAADRYGGIENVPMAVYTARFAGVEGGTLKWGEFGPLHRAVEPGCRQHLGRGPERHRGHFRRGPPVRSVHGPAMAAAPRQGRIDRQDRPAGLQVARLDHPENGRHHQRPGRRLGGLECHHADLYPGWSWKDRQN